MTDEKFDLLKEIHSYPYGTVSKTEFYLTKGPSFAAVDMILREMHASGYLNLRGNSIELLPAGIAAMEEEARIRKHREEDIKLQHELAEKTAKDAKKARRQQWVAIIISGVFSLAATIISIISLLQSAFK